MATDIILIGVPKDISELPQCIVNPVQKMKYLWVLAKLDHATHDYIVCPVTNGRGSNSKRCVGSRDGLQVMTLPENDMVPAVDHGNKVFNTLQHCNNNDSLKLQYAIANCMVEIHRSKQSLCDESFDRFVDTNVCTWPYKYTSPGAKMVMIWKDNGGQKHVVICPSISHLVRLCPQAVTGGIS